MVNLAAIVSWFAMVSVLGVAVAQTVTSGTTSATSPPVTPAPTHGPFPTASAIPLPSEFSDLPQSNVQCWDSLISYDMSRSFLWAQEASAEVYTYTEYPTPVTETGSYGYSLETCSTAFPGLTTLCDGYPRANDCIVNCQSTGYTSWTEQFTVSGTGRWLTPSWSSEILQLAAPTCTVAADLSPECSRLADAYTWRTSHLDPTASITPPPCAISIPATIQPTPPAHQRCSLSAESYEAYYWPSPSGSNSNAFCNGTVPTRKPGRPKTAVVSGMTFTSPDIYHILHNATVYKYVGQSSSIGYGEGGPIYSISTELPTMTFAQPATSILSQYVECHKPSPHGATRCTLSHKPDFAIKDMFTIRAKAYYGKDLPTPPTIATICQASYTPTIGLPLLEVAKQNKVGEDCEWTFGHSGRTTLLEQNMYSVKGFSATDFHAITVQGEGASATGVPQSGFTKVAMPTPSSE